MWHWQRHGLQHGGEGAGSALQMQLQFGQQGRLRRQEQQGVWQSIACRCCRAKWVGLRVCQCSFFWLVQGFGLPAQILGRALFV
jgi:hypothetical protein